MTAMMNSSIEKDYKQGLQQLKAYVEQKVTSANK
jgi:hypothetical protein